MKSTPSSDAPYAHSDTPAESRAAERNPRLLAALAYAARGWAVLPIHTPTNDEPPCSCGRPDCSSVGKHPRTPHGLIDASKDEACIREWWRLWPGANVAVATGARSDLVALDIDPRNGGDESLAELLREHGPIPETVEAHTGGGGRHLFFRCPHGAAKSRSGIRPGIDVKADGGYIVVEPSLHASGRRYVWELSHRAEDHPLADCPPWLAAEIAPSPSPASRASRQSSGQTTIPEGKRNDTLTRLAGSMRRWGASAEAIRAALAEDNARRCVPPLSAEEVETIASGIARYAPDADGALELVTLADVVPVPVSWLWWPRIPLGKITVLGGHPGLGKSFLTLDLAARVSAGLPWPDQPGEPAPRGGVVLLSAEDDLADTIRPRLDACGADTERITAIRGRHRAKTNAPEPITLEDIDALEEAIARTPETRFVVVDPFGAVVPESIDANSNSDVRRMLYPLATLAARSRVAMLLVTHLNKAHGSKGIARFTGSLALPAAARSAWLVVEHPTDRARRKMLPAKSNLGPDALGMGYRITGDPPRVEWESLALHEHADDALAAESDSSSERSAVGEACEWLRGELALGPVPVKELEQRGVQEGIQSSTLRAARAALGIKPRREGFGPGGRWVVALPIDGAQPA